MTGWVVHTLVSSSLLMLAVLALRKPVARLFGPRIAYALWLLPALRILLPTLPGWRTPFAPLFDLAGPGMIDPAALPDAGMIDLLPTSPDALPIGAMAASGWAQPDWPGIMLALWVGGAILWFAWQLLRYRGFVRGALRDARLLATEQGVEVLISPRVEGPLAAGVLTRRIFLPVDFLTRYTSAERHMALLHEGAHHDRRDIAANFAGLAVVALHWWNPIAHHAYRAFRTDQELACDATVLAGAAAAERHAYGSAILKSAVLAIPTAACALNHKTQIKRRIAMLKPRNAGRARNAVGGVLAAMLIGGGLLVTATGSIAAVAPPAPVMPPAPITPPALVVPPPPAPPLPVAEPAPAPRSSVRGEVRPVPPLPPLAAIDAGRIERDAVRAERDAARAQRDADRALRYGDIERRVAVSLADSRARTADRCRAQGVVMQKEADWSALATCNGNVQQIIRVSLARARQAILQTSDLSDSQRTEALAGLDRAQANIDRDAAARRD